MSGEFGSRESEMMDNTQLEENVEELEDIDLQMSNIGNELGEEFGDEMMNDQDDEKFKEQRKREKRGELGLLATFLCCKLCCVEVFICCGCLIPIVSVLAIIISSGISSMYLDSHDCGDLKEFSYFFCVNSTSLALDEGILIEYLVTNVSLETCVNLRKSYFSTTKDYNSELIAMGKGNSCYFITDESGMTRSQYETAIENHQILESFCNITCSEESTSSRILQEEKNCGDSLGYYYSMYEEGYDIFCTQID